MPAQALYRKWRPQLWDEVYGQEPVVQTLRNALRTGHIAHAYLFCRPARLRQNHQRPPGRQGPQLHCHPDPAQRPDNTCPHCQAVDEGRFLDLIEIDGASNNGVDHIRDLRDSINFAPSEGRYKIYIIDEVAHAVHAGLQRAAQNARRAAAARHLHPGHHREPQDSRPPSPRAASASSSAASRWPISVARLKNCASKSRSTVEPAALEMVARQATGSLRDAISLLDQLLRRRRDTSPWPRPRSCWAPAPARWSASW